MSAHGKYIDKLNSIPAPGNGCHAALLGAANLGILDGVSAEEIFYHIRGSIPAGKRKVTDKEIQEAIIRVLPKIMEISFYLMVKDTGIIFRLNRSRLLMTAKLHCSGYLINP